MSLRKFAKMVENRGLTQFTTKNIKLYLDARLPHYKYNSCGDNSFYLNVYHNDNSEYLILYDFNDCGNDSYECKMRYNERADIIKVGLVYEDQYESYRIAKRERETKLVHFFKRCSCSPYSDDYRIIKEYLTKYINKWILKGKDKITVYLFTKPDNGITNKDYITVDTNQGEMKIGIKNFKKFLRHSTKYYVALQKKRVKEHLFIKNMKIC